MLTLAEIEALSDGRVNTMLAEREGWRVLQGEDGSWSLFAPRREFSVAESVLLDDLDRWLLASKWAGQYVISTDEALRFAMRKELRLSLLCQADGASWLARFTDEPANSFGATPARAVCNAALAAMLRRERAAGESREGRVDSHG